MIGRYVWRPTRSHTLATGGGVGQSENPVTYAENQLSLKHYQPRKVCFPLKGTGTLIAVALTW
jgi:hypothetical protein